MSDATQGDSRRDSKGDTSRDTATVTEAAKLLGVTIRTVQRRLDRGELNSIEEGGKRLVLMPAKATADTSGNAIRRDSDTRHDATGDVTGHEAVARLLEEKDARIADLRATVDAQRLQIEAANRTAAETAAAMRDLVKLQAKALPAPGNEGALQAAQSAPDSVAATRTQPTITGQQQPAEREPRPLWKLIFGVR